MDEKPDILKRLAIIDEKKKAERERKREQGREDLDPRESIDEFIKKFNIEISNISKLLDDIQFKIKNSGKVNGNKVNKEDYDKIISDLLKIDESVSSAAYYLPAYDVRQSRATIASMRNQIEESKKKYAGKKKFSFTKKPVLKNKNIEEDETKTEENIKNQLSEINQEIKGIKNLNDKNIILKKEDIGEGEYAISDCKDSQISLIAPLSALHIKNVFNCEITAGPVKGSTFIENFCNSKIQLASRQVRIHDSRNSKFYLRIKSHPIIEDTKDVSFASLKNIELIKDNEEMEEWLKESNLDEENELWKDVKDFGWLADGQSPNWNLL